MPLIEDENGRRRYVSHIEAYGVDLHALDVTDPPKPFAYYIHIAVEQRGEFVHDLDEALDDLTNCECKVTELFDHAAPVAGGKDAWKPIETAPKTRRAILVWCPAIQCTFAVSWYDDAWIFFGASGELRDFPTHWMPLPKAPGDQP